MTDLHGALEKSLGPIYRVEREVRPVGNCRLFVASQPPDMETLVVKVLPSTLSLGVEDRVFERELVLLSDRLKASPLVLTRGSGRAGTYVYHTRAFVPGTTLRNWIARQGGLPLRKVVDIARDVLGALAPAHAAGVGHGDLKPENVLLAEHGTHVADTGVVAAVQRSLGAAAPPNAALAALCATAYVAPERREGSLVGVPGPAEDIFSLGVMLHEMLAGRPPAPESEPLEELRSVPSWLGELVRRCLSPRADDRWKDAEDAMSVLPRQAQS